MSPFHKNSAAICTQLNFNVVIIHEVKYACAHTWIGKFISQCEVL